MSRASKQSNYARGSLWEGGKPVKIEPGGRGPANLLDPGNTVLRKYGLLRNVVVHVPWFWCYMQCLVVHLLHLVMHLLLVVAIVSEALGVIGASGDDSFGAAGRLPKHADANHKAAALRLLGAIIYDGFLGLCVASHTIAWAIGLPTFGDDSTAILRRLAVLQSATSCALHFSAVIRWRRRSTDYSVPPLFLLLAYCLVPWLELSAWILTMRVDDHLLGGGLCVDMLILCCLFVVRKALFGDQGLTRVARTHRGLGNIIGDALVLGIVAVIFDAMILRSAWLERRRNWKYVFCVANLAWPFFMWSSILSSFRGEPSASKQKISAFKVPHVQMTDETGATVRTGHLRSRIKRKMPDSADSIVGETTSLLDSSSSADSSTTSSARSFTSFPSPSKSPAPGRLSTVKLSPVEEASEEQLLAPAAMVEGISSESADDDSGTDG